MSDSSRTVKLIAELFQNELYKKRITEAQLADLLNINQGTVNKYIKRRVKTPDLSTLIKVKKYFNKSYEYFLESSGENEKDYASIQVQVEELRQQLRSIDDKLKTLITPSKNI